MGIEALISALDKSEKSLGELAERVDLQQSTVRRIKRNNRIANIGIALDMILSIVIGIGWQGVNGNQTRIHDLQVALQQETDRNKAATCAVVTLFASFKDHTLSNPTFSNGDHTLQQAAFDELARIGVQAQCPNP